jgi:hypothetical protein
MRERGLAGEFDVFTTLIEFGRDRLARGRANLLHILHNAAIKHLKIIEVDE